jgi:TolA-binding protein
MMKAMRMLALVVAATAGWASASAAASVELSNGTRVEGSDIRARSDGTIILTTPQGQVTYQRGQYVKAVADKPADFDRARQMAGQKQFDEAIKLLQPIVQNYRFLEWDNNARVLIAQIQIAKGDPAGAVATFDDLFRGTPDAKKDSATLWAYYGALIDAKQFEKLAPQLDELIAKGARTDAAKAQILRGDIKMAQGQIEGAAMDYLRSAILFESEKTVQPEALFKAGEALDKLRDPRAKDMYRKVAQEYAGTPFAQKAQGKF